MEGLSIPHPAGHRPAVRPVTTRDIAAGVSEAGFTIGSNQVLPDRAIKTPGVHNIREAPPRVDLMININVAKSEEEALGLIEEEEDDFGQDPNSAPSITKTATSGSRVRRRPGLAEEAAAGAATPAKLGRGRRRLIRPRARQHRRSRLATPGLSFAVPVRHGAARGASRPHEAPRR